MYFFFLFNVFFLNGHWRTYCSPKKIAKRIEEKLVFVINKKNIFYSFYSIKLKTEGVISHAVKIVSGDREGSGPAHTACHTCITVDPPMASQNGSPSIPFPQNPLHH